MKWLLTTLLIALVSNGVYGQCTTQGQTPETAFPVCASAVFHQKKVPNCVNHLVPVPGCENDEVDYTDESPFWYKITCFESGTLGFLIDPDNVEDDYDWQLFDVTGHEVEDVYTDPSLVVAGNWSGESGKTGAASVGTSSMVCATTNKKYHPLFSPMPQLSKGHEYLLLVSHYSGSSQSGYDLSFQGGTAVITDETPPAMDAVLVHCDGKFLTVFLNKRLKCNSLAADGSDFEIVGSSVDIVSAESKDCHAGFDMEQLTLELDTRLDPGNYTLQMKNGTDGNTLLDNCDVAVPEGDEVAFKVETPHPFPMDSVTQLVCEPKSIEVVFTGLIKGNSVAADGSDFRIENIQTGEALVISGAESVNEENGKSATVRISLPQSIKEKSNYRLVLQEGSDGNTVISGCDIASIAEQEITFKSYDTVSADFQSDFNYQCNEVKINLNHAGENGVNTWSWMINNQVVGDQAAFSYTDTSFLAAKVQLEVSNGICNAKEERTITPDRDYYIHADFSIPDFVCPQDRVSFKNHSRGGHITNQKWNLGDGKVSFLSEPEPQHFPTTRFTQEYKVQLFLQNSHGCKDTMQRVIKVINTCTIYVPTAFTPNDDGQNDRLYPLNAYKAKDLIFKVYNRYGQLMYQTEDWTRGWDGRYKGKEQPPGSYVWTLDFVNVDTEQRMSRKGAALLIR